MMKVNRVANQGPMWYCPWQQQTGLGIKAIGFLSLIYLVNDCIVSTEKGKHSVHAAWQPNRVKNKRCDSLSFSANNKREMREMNKLAM